MPSAKLEWENERLPPPSLPSSPSSPLSSICTVVASIFAAVAAAVIAVVSRLKCGSSLARAGRGRGVA
eukprot:8954331-Lingulodinium_polyedra.AAC.2